MTVGKKTYVLADHTKFELSTPVLIAPVSQIAGLIVDKSPPKSLSQALADRHWQVIVARP
jgi:DeoR family glycerol-3-phosphate regulon repressor